MSVLTEYVYSNIADTMSTMLADRGYARDVDDIFVHEGDDDRVLTKILVPKDEGKQDGKSALQNIVIDMEKLGIRHSVIASYRGFTSAALSQQRELANRYRIEIFQYHELMIPVVSHYAVPPHTLLDEEEKEDLLSKLGIAPGTEQHVLPILKTRDPVARYYGYSPGDVVLIERSKNDIYYRIVSD